ncbi:aspartate aminotransferase family protein [Rhizobium sp. Root482]|uniref:aspartate aminotransferase family protein n=1 Tax=Rhizobium sp. Root482 TaxID=1736543 RepID=UPI0006F7D102|nr:aspartate aminotransferase family protein [Rhizobium sp. Root482]KQY18565.1 glutamate-1-semialdehyde 2,1-aminomutase [Rhizobium sp. Root482]
MSTAMTAGAAGRAYARSAALHRRGRVVFPGGITRSTIDTDPHPIYVSRGEGAYVIDEDNNRLLDLNNNFTTLMHGHAFAPVIGAVTDLLRKGTCFANPTHHEIALAELLVSRIPAIEQVRFVNSGTEAVMFAIKAARAFTGRQAIARFAGSYHGSYDWAETGQSGAVQTAGDERRVARAAYHGAPPTTADAVVVLDFNDVDGLEIGLAPRAERLAAILIDPMPSRAGLLAPLPQFIERLNALASRHGILIIADEVLNLRQGYNGSSSRYGLEPDLVTAGKIIGGGFPIGAVGGRSDVMSVFGSDVKAPLVPQGGTFSANPVSMLAGRMAMEAMTPDEFARLERLGDRLRAQLTATAAKHAAPFSIAGAASLFRIHAKRSVPGTYANAIMTTEEATRMRSLSRYFRDEGVLLPCGAAACLSTPMTEMDTDKVSAAFDRFLTACGDQTWERQA